MQQRLFCKGSTPKVLYVYYCAGELLNASGNDVSTNRLRGSEVYKINLYKNLKKNGIQPVLILGHDFDLGAAFEKCGAFCYKTDLSRQPSKSDALAKAMRDVCVKEKIELIHCNSMVDVAAAKEVAKHLPVRIVATLHTDKSYESELLRNLDGVIGVSAHALDMLKRANAKKHLGIKHVTWIPPFYDEEKFLKPRVERTREQFFAKEFGVSLPKYPTVCMIANFYQEFKNHEVVLQAAQILKRDYQRPVNIVFAGIGQKMDDIKKYAKKLNIESTTFFLGMVDNQLVPELLFHTDVEVLMSFTEAFGIALLEGALMKKPLIGTRGTGMESIIKHEQTGLLCDVRDAHTLAQQISFLVNNPKRALELGQNVYSFAVNNLSMKAGIETLKVFYQQVLRT